MELSLLFFQIIYWSLESIKHPQLSYETTTATNSSIVPLRYICGTKIPMELLAYFASIAKNNLTEIYIPL